MSEPAELHVGDTGTAILLTLRDEDGKVISLADYISLVLLMRRPDGLLLQKSCNLYTDGTDGIARYVTTSSDWNVPGNYKFQLYAQSPQGHWHTTTEIRNVLPNLI